MYVELKNIKTIVSGGFSIEFEKDITRYLEYGDTAIVYTEENETIFGICIKENENGVSNMEVIWKFNERPILSFSKDNYKEKEVVRVITDAPFHDILYLLDAKTGEIILETPTR